jgi:hypothetical protein
MPPHPEPESELRENFATHQHSRENRKDSILVSSLCLLVLVTHLNFVVFVWFLYYNHLAEFSWPSIYRYRLYPAIVLHELCLINWPMSCTTALLKLFVPADTYTKLYKTCNLCMLLHAVFHIWSVDYMHLLASFTQTLHLFTYCLYKQCVPKKLDEMALHSPYSVV